MDSFKALKSLLVKLRDQSAKNAPSADHRKAQVSDTLAKLQAISDKKNDQ